MKLLRNLGYAFGVIAVMAVIGIGIGLWVYRDIPIEHLETKYANQASRFISIDGTRIHFRDEGSGPAVLLLHANFSNLIDWDPWVKALSDSYRVVRFDFTSHGLTGVDPSHDYSLERTLELTEKFIDAMDLEHFSIAGASMGGTVAILYTRKHRDRINNLILISPDSFEYNAKIPGSPDEVPKIASLLAYIMPRAVPELMLKSGFGNQEKLTDELVDRWYDMWMHQGQREAQLERLRQYETGGAAQLIRSLQTRTLVQQGSAIQTEFENIEALQVISYPNVGYWVVQEAGQESARDARIFLDEGQPAE